MGRWCGRRDITELTLKTALNTIQSINQPFTELRLLVEYFLGHGLSAVLMSFVSDFKGSSLDFFTSHRIKKKTKNIYIGEIYMKKQYKSSINKNHKIEKIDIF